MKNITKSISASCSKSLPQISQLRFKKPKFVSFLLVFQCCLTTSIKVTSFTYKVKNLKGLIIDWFYVVIVRNKAACSNPTIDKCSTSRLGNNFINNLSNLLKIQLKPSLSFHHAKGLSFNFCKFTIIYTKDKILTFCCVTESPPNLLLFFKNNIKINTHHHAILVFSLLYMIFHKSNPHFSVYLVYVIQMIYICYSLRTNLW